MRPTLTLMLATACARHAPPPPPPPPEPPVGPPILPVQHVPYADGFDFPVGAPHGIGYYDAQPFGLNHHLGSDWNGDGGGATDLGDPVTAAAAGLVAYSGDAGIGWGNVVVVTHLLGPDEVVETLYGHLDRKSVRVGQRVARGALLGTIGDAHGRYVPHLHFELRTTPGLGVGGGYAASTDGWADPTAFILAHRPSGAPQ
jgi:hypothetical protein